MKKPLKPARENISPSDLTYYLDWAALAGMTELQFEKICRGAGKSVVVNEFPYGLGTSPTAYTAVTGSGTASELGTPAGTAVLPSVNYLNAFNAANSVTTGPMRVGQSYTALTVRESASSAYYGVDEGLCTNSRKPYLHHATDVGASHAPT